MKYRRFAQKKRLFLLKIGRYDIDFPAPEEQNKEIK